jgi:hypothetical protein
LKPYSWPMNSYQTLVPTKKKINKILMPSVFKWAAWPPLVSASSHQLKLDGSSWSLNKGALPICLVFNIWFGVILTTSTSGDLFIYLFMYLFLFSYYFCTFTNISFVNDLTIYYCWIYSIIFRLCEFIKTTIICLMPNVEFDKKVYLFIFSWGWKS